MTIPALLLAGAVAFGHGAAVDQRPYGASRSNAIIEAAAGQGADAPSPEAATARYPSADGDILAGLGQAMSIPPLPPAHSIAAVFPSPTAPSADRSSPDASGLLGGPKR